MPVCQRQQARVGAATGWCMRAATGQYVRGGNRPVCTRQQVRGNSPVCTRQQAQVYATTGQGVCGNRLVDARQQVRVYAATGPGVCGNRLVCVVGARQQACDSHSRGYDTEAID